MPDLPASTPDSRRPNCTLCRYFRCHGGGPGNGHGHGDGDCRRYPPAFAGESSPNERHHWRFPPVSAESWCGEFKADDVGGQPQ